MDDIWRFPKRGVPILSSILADDFGTPISWFRIETHGDHWGFPMETAGNRRLLQPRAQPPARPRRLAEAHRPKPGGRTWSAAGTKDGDAMRKCWILSNENGEK